MDEGVLGSSSIESLCVQRLCGIEGSRQIGQHLLVEKRTPRLSTRAQSVASKVVGQELGIVTLRRTIPSMVEVDRQGGTDAADSLRTKIPRQHGFGKSDSGFMAWEYGIRPCDALSEVVQNYNYSGSYSGTVSLSFTSPSRDSVSCSSLQDLWSLAGAHQHLTQLVLRAFPARKVCSALDSTPQHSHRPAAPIHPLSTSYTCCCALTIPRPLLALFSGCASALCCAKPRTSVGLELPDLVERLARADDTFEPLGPYGDAISTVQQRVVRCGRPGQHVSGVGAGHSALQNRSPIPARWPVLRLQIQRFLFAG
jgi:hypothetical protein